MSGAAREIAELELHGYLDGELAGSRAEEVAAHLDQDEEATAKLFHYGLQGDLIRRLYGPLLNRPLPPPLADRLAAVMAQRPQGGSSLWSRLRRGFSS